jgi:hypothetical protein
MWSSIDIHMAPRDPLCSHFMFRGSQVFQLTLWGEDLGAMSQWVYDLTPFPSMISSVAV